MRRSCLGGVYASSRTLPQLRGVGIVGTAPAMMSKRERCCQRCSGAMAVVDVLLEGYDLVCTRCGERELVIRTLREPPPCFQ